LGSDAASAPGDPVRLTPAMLVGANWRYGHDGAPPSPEPFQFLPNGGIDGYDHPNERVWRLEDGTLSLFRFDGQRTVRFDDATVHDDRLVLRGKYLLAPALHLTLALQRDYAPPATATPPPPAIGYAFHDGGLNNQKLALLGLFKAAHESDCAVALPRMSILDQVEMSRRPVPFGAVFDLASITSFADRYGIRISEAGPSIKGPDGWHYFAKGRQYLNGYFSDRARDAAYRFPPDFFRSLVPLARGSYVLRKLHDDVYERLGVSVAAQFRIEADWQRHSERDLRGPLGGREDYLPHFERIVEKILNTLPDTRHVYVTCDEAALPVSTVAMRQACRARFGIELLWKSTFLTRFELALLTPLELSLIDFEMALRAPRFVGMTRSTFSNLVTFEKYCLIDKPIREHYIYNTNGDTLGRRTDNGVYDDAARVVSAALS